MMRIIFTGSGEFGVPALQAILAGPHEIVQVVSQPDRPAGRGRELSPTPVSRVAIQRALPLLRTADINRESLPAADLMIVIAFGQKISEPIVRHSRLGSINLHASRLPKYRGAAPINWAILKGESVTGNSIIRLAPKMDAGAILAQSELPIGDLETAGELHDRLSLDGAALTLRAIEALADGQSEERPQDESLATLAPKLSRESARLDFAHPADELARQIRGLYPWPGCRVRLADAAGNELARLRLVRAAAAPTEGLRWHPGEIMTDGTIQTGSGGLQILECQPEGRKPMPLADYRRGHPWPAGAQLRGIE